MSKNYVLSMAEKEALVCPTCPQASAYNCAACMEESRKMPCQTAKRMPCADDVTSEECVKCMASRASYE